MVRPLNQLFSPTTVSTTFFAASVTGATFTLSANNIADGLGHQITIIGLGMTDLSAINVTIVGLDSDGASQTEIFALPNGTATVTSTLFYKTLLSVTPASTIGAATVKIGFNDVVATRTFPLNFRGGLPIMSVVVGGTINYTVQFTMDTIQAVGTTRPYNWQSVAGSPIVASTITASDSYNTVPLAIRLLINSYSSGATALFEVSQKDI